ncbi:unnamed protein product [Cylicocyclus nassatus]|uniref:Uncharacterized protein n=1 Tax=Cylicocyclus nassatus TaxID=53992 RepID=A0AA36GIN6_CYLNA|nr:unnamed protein product [Cylicocyclus nassatus]
MLPEHEIGSDSESDTDSQKNMDVETQNQVEEQPKVKKEPTEHRQTRTGGGERGSSAEAALMHPQQGRDNPSRHNFVHRQPRRRLYFR